MSDLKHLLAEHEKSLEKFEAAEKTYSRVVAQHHRRHPADPITADYCAASDSRLKQAVGDAAYYRDRALMYGLSALIELMRGQR